MSLLAHRIVSRFLTANARADSGQPERWHEFMKAVYEGGKKKVPNPNPKTKARYPTVSITTALKDQGVRQRVMEEYRKWLGEKGPETKSEGPSTTIGPDTLDTWHKDVRSVHDKYRADFDKIVKSTKADIAAYRKRFKGTAQLRRFEKLSPGEQVLHAAGHKFGEFFEGKIMRKDAFFSSKKVSKADFHEAMMSGWRGSAGSAEAQMLHGLLGQLGVKGYRSPEDSGKEDFVEKFRKMGVESQDLAEYAKEVYTYTQAALRHIKAFDITVYRGVTGQGVSDVPPKQGDKVQVQTRELSSFTTEPTVAKVFGRVMEYTIPAERVFASCLTSPRLGGDMYSSSWKEYEIMVMGASDLTGRIAS